MSQGPLCPNLSQKVQKEVSQMANHNLSCVILLGGLSVNHLKIKCWRNEFGNLSISIIFSFQQVFVRLVTKEQIVINVKLDTMVMEIHVLAVALTRLHLQVVVLQLQTNVSLPCFD